MDIKWIVTITSIAIIYVIYVPLTLHFLRTFLRYKSKVVIAKRHPNIVAIFSLFCIAYLAISRPVSLVVAVMLSTKQNSTIVIYLDTFVASFFHSFTLLPVALLLLTKYWLIFWDIQRIQHSFNFEWKTLINPYFYLMTSQTLAAAKSLSRTTTISSILSKDNVLPKDIIHQQKFWSAHKSTFGDEKHMIKLTLIVSLIISSISATFWIVIYGLLSYEKIATIFDFTVCFLALGGICILNAKTPTMMDRLHIRDEVSYVAAGGLWPLIINIIAYMLMSDPFWRTIITSHIISFSLFILSTFQLKYVFIRCKYLIHVGKNAPQRQIVVSSMSKSKSLVSSSQSHSNKNSSDSESYSTSVSISRSLQQAQAAKKNAAEESLSPSATAVERLEKMRKVSQEITLISEKKLNKHVIDALDWLHNKQDKNGKRNSEAKLTNVLPNVVDDQTVTFKKTTSLAKVLKNQKNLERFMHHLSLEFSMEIILGFIEFTQILDILASKLCVNNSDHDDHASDIEHHDNSNNNKNQTNKTNETTNKVNETTNNNKINNNKNNVHSMHKDCINLFELNDEILSNPDYIAFYSFLDSALFVDTDIDLSRMKIFEFPDTVPTSFILFNNLYNIANVVTLNARPEASTIVTNPFTSINRPMIVLENVNDFDENETKIKLLYESMGLLLLQLSSFYSIGYELYTKYIKRGSEFELSINSYLKERFCEIFDEYDFLKFINNFSQQQGLTLTDFDFEMDAKMRHRIHRMKYQFEIAIHSDMSHHISCTDNNYNTAMQASHKDNATFLSNLQKGINVAESETLSYTTSYTTSHTNPKNLSQRKLSNQFANPIQTEDDDSFAPSTTFNSARLSDTGQNTNESESVGSAEMCRQKTQNLLIERIRIHDLSWLLIKEKFNHDYEMVEKIHNQLRNNVFAFLLLISKLFRKTNDELKSLLLFSFDRLVASNEKHNRGPLFD